MRTYVGTVQPDGRTNVVIRDGAEPVTPAEIADFLDELAEVSSLRYLGRPHPEPERLHVVLQRKRELIERIEHPGPEPRPLPNPGVHSPDGFDWGYQGNGPADLALAILQREIPTTIPRDVYLGFRDDVVASLPRDRFELTAEQVWTWIREHGYFIEPTPEASPEQPALAVTDTSAVGAAADDADGATTGADDAEEPPPDDLTTATASKLVEACETAWADIRSHHAELPEVVIVLGSGVERGRLVKLGHWWGGRWIADGQPRGEVLLAGEALHLEPRQVFEVLLHEAAHGINAARGVKDTSRGGRYHNERFAATAREVGLDVRSMPPYGMAATSLTDDTSERYASAIDRLGETMRIARQLQGVRGVGPATGQEIEGSTGGGADGGPEKSRNSPSASCGCGRKLRIAASTLAKGPIVCGLCATEFTVGAEARHTPTRETESGEPDRTVDDTFQERRREELRAEDDATLRDRLVADHDRLTAELGDSAVVADGSALPLSVRRDRIEQALAALDEQRRPVPAGRADPRVARWYEHYGTLHEAPIPAADAFEVDELTRRARAVLRHDGVLRGPDLDLGPLDVAVGDRIVVHDDIPDGPPPGTLGTVVIVDLGAERATVDFDTWGTLDIAADSDRAAAVVHDYAAVAPDPETIARQALELERQRALVLEPGP